MPVEQNHTMPVEQTNVTPPTPFLLQVLKSLPWKKVDKKIISVEVARGKLDESLDYEPDDQRDNVVTTVFSAKKNMI